MKPAVLASSVVVLLLCLTSPWDSRAQVTGPTANGSYKFVLDDDLTKYVEFTAATDDRGTTSGRMSFSDEARVFEADVDGTGGSKDEPAPFTLNADLDSLTIEKNRAAMSGVITQSTHSAYVGRWVQLIVEDNGDGREIPDKFIWRVCTVEPDGWIPSDAEIPKDDGAFRHWWATDAEVKTDVGIPSVDLIPNSKLRCEQLPLSSYVFDSVKAGSGNIVVQP